ncbi:MAG: Endo-1,4-beta-xylanase A precursor [Pelotomaculum sp. PtaB.Bin104]|nr:MAG: Endo-1,4-beta-xylanase A precursor [Pelotomaculum sp. PtaB.Bin104]
MRKKSLAVLLALAVFIFLFTATTAFATEFSDMPNNWSTEALNNAVSNGLLKGYNGKILPNDPLTRAQMATVVNRAFGATEKASLSGYTDIDSHQWYYDEMAKAVQMKTIVGSGNNLYPDNNITREETFVVLARAFRLSGAADSALDKFSDKNLVSPWAKDAVSSLVAAGYIKGSNGQINPKQSITRAEFAQLMDNLLKKYINVAGTYTIDYSGNVMVNTPGIVLKDLTITGDLIIGDGVGDGQVTLDSVIITGRTVILVSGVNSVKVINTAAPEALKIADYFPVQGYASYVYEGIGNEYASYSVFIDYASAGKVQQRVDNGGTVAARVLELKDGKLIRQLFQGETYYRENLLNVTDASAEILLMEPLKAGISWTLKDGRTRKITSISADAATPLGSYKAIAVVTEGPYDTITEYYAKDVGMVKSVFTSGGEEISSSLKELIINASRLETINFYYPNIDDGKLYFQNKEVSFHTNDVTVEILAEEYKIIPNSSVGEVFSTNTRINSLTLNTDNKVAIDLNASFVSEMNAGAEYETMLLQCIANTFGQYYNAQEVSITIDSQPYSSGHISMQEGQSIPVNFEDTIEIM